MSYDNRKVLYKEIENIRQRPLIVYATSIRVNSNGNMAGDVIPEFIKQLSRIPKTEKNIDILIISNGGDAITSWRIIGLLRERFEKIGVLVPFVAYSAATLLALGANEIVMHPYSNIGPIDPQMTLAGPNGNTSFSSEDIRNYIEFIKKDLGINEQAQLASALDLLCKDRGVGPIILGSIKRSQQLSLALGEKMLLMHMDDKQKAHDIAEALNSSYYHHGYTVGRKEALNMGLNVIRPDMPLEDLMWRVWENISEDMKCDRPFDLMTELMDNPSFNYLKNFPTISIPGNAPANIANQIINQVLTQHISVREQRTIQMSRLIAVLESDKCYSKFSLDSEILAWRTPEASVSVNVTDIQHGWVFHA